MKIFLQVFSIKQFLQMQLIITIIDRLINWLIFQNIYFKQHKG